MAIYYNNNKQGLSKANYSLVATAIEISTAEGMNNSLLMSNVDKLFHYVGDTTDSYINDHYYKCITNGSSVYFIDLGGVGGGSASEITYDNATSGLNATNVQAAIDESLNVSNKLAEENAYTTNVIITANNLGVDTLVVEDFKTANYIDQTLLDGASVVSQYFKANKHAIVKTSSDTLSIESTLFEVSDTPYKAWINLDYTGTGSINAYISKNNGSDWTQLTNNQVKSINALVQKNIRIKLELVGVVTLKNLAWGVM